LERNLFKITIEPDGHKIEANPGETFRSALSCAGYYFPQNCGGKGQCGQCRIEFHGNPPGSLQREEELLGTGSSIRLACLHKVKGNARVSLRIESAWDVDKTVQGFQPPASDDGGYGIAVDLGTTAVALYLVDLSEGRIAAQHSFLNPQVRYGGDVMTRLDLAKSDIRRDELAEVIRQGIAEGINTLLIEGDADRIDLRRIFLAGNTPMVHLFTGRAGEGLERAPFRSPLEGKGILPIDPDWLGLDSACRCDICPVIQGFIGGDITAAILAARLDKDPGNRLLVDFGTNGEIVMATDGDLSATSTAAGPAFEGVGMRHGMPALSGAVEGFSSDGEPYVIGGGQPKGFCGSGYISALAMLLKKSIMDRTGLLAKDPEGQRRWTIKEGKATSPSIIQDDVRKFQYAKGAVAAGIEILLDEADLHPDRLDEIILTGSFGNRIDPEATMEIGLIPAVIREKVSFIDNAAGRGAMLGLGSDDDRERALNLQKSVRVVNLGDHPRFQEVYIANMSFPEADSGKNTRIIP
jgi:uncharacterized 2Fe-2S/4Fe-4S cluster protein (DUF4445 family)